jgi:hypothetical protein
MKDEYLIVGALAAMWYLSMNKKRGQITASVSVSQKDPIARATDSLTQVMDSLISLGKRFEKPAPPSQTPQILPVDETTREVESLAKRYPPPPNPSLSEEDAFLYGQEKPRIGQAMLDDENSIVGPDGTIEMQPNINTWSSADFDNQYAVY